MMLIRLILKLVLLILMISIDNVLSKAVTVFNRKVGQLFTSSLLTWEAFDANNPHQLEHAVIGGEFTDKTPAYICRSTINSVALTGYVMTRHDKPHVCILSMHSQIKTKGEFDLLMNRGSGAKIEWQYWEKAKIVFTHIDGAVATINGGSRSEVYYIARHKRNHSMEHHEIDHAIGWFDPSEGFGKIHGLVASSEMTFDSGEILTTFEPVQYELHDMKFLKTNLKETRNRTLLGSAMLSNEGDSTNDAGVFLGYGYDVVRNLGHAEGIARSINTTVFVSKEPVQSFFWGIQQNDHVEKTKGVSSILQPGTALNVTLWGNYTRKEGSYHANLVIHWSDGSKTKKKRILVHNALEADLEDQLEIEYSPTFWLHNNTIVPTTTQRTTTTSTSTTSRSIFSTSMSSGSVEQLSEKSSRKPDESEEIDDEDNEIEKTSSTTNIHLQSGVVMLIVMTLIHLIAAH